jgi:hypothetical protein
MATRVDAAILDRVREEELAERIQCFLLVEKRTNRSATLFSGARTGRSVENATRGRQFDASTGTASGLSLAFGKTPRYYHECMFNVSYL